jgi:hypothetical protein
MAAFVLKQSPGIGGLFQSGKSGCYTRYMMADYCAAICSLERTSATGFGSILTLHRDFQY